MKIDPKAGWQSGHAAACKAVYAGSIPTLASIRISTDRDKASRWLTAASRGLGGEVPLQLLDTDIGTQRVQQELREIEYGMPL